MPTQKGPEQYPPTGRSFCLGRGWALRGGAFAHLSLASTSEKCPKYVQPHKICTLVFTTTTKYQSTFFKCGHFKMATNSLTQVPLRGGVYVPSLEWGGVCEHTTSGRRWRCCVLASGSRLEAPWNSLSGNQTPCCEEAQAAPRGTHVKGPQALGRHPGPPHQPQGSGSTRHRGQTQGPCPQAPLAGSRAN